MNTLYFYLKKYNEKFNKLNFSATEGEVNFSLNLIIKEKHKNLLSGGGGLSFLFENKLWKIGNLRSSVKLSNTNIKAIDHNANYINSVHVTAVREDNGKAYFDVFPTDKEQPKIQDEHLAVTRKFNHVGPQKNPENITMQQANISMDISQLPEELYKSTFSETAKLIFAYNKSFVNFHPKFYKDHSSLMKIYNALRKNGADENELNRFKHLVTKLYELDKIKANFEITTSMQNNEETMVLPVDLFNNFCQDTKSSQDKQLSSRISDLLIYNEKLPLLKHGQGYIVKTQFKDVMEEIKEIQFPL